MKLIKRLLPLLAIAGLLIYPLLARGQVAIEGIGTLSFSNIAYAATERQSPNAILAITELSPNNVAYIQDDPDSPDANWLVASGNNVNTDVRVSFPTPTGNPTVGADLQQFKAWVRQFDEGQTGTPDVRIELWENGVLVRAGADEAVTTGGHMITFTWNANEIGTPDGSLVEYKVVGTKTGGSPSTRNTVDVGAVEWNVDYTTATPNISNSPSSYNFGIVSESANYTTGLDHFTVTNSSGAAVDISIQGTDMVGGTTWTLANDASPGINIYGLKTGTSGDGDYITVVKKDSPYNNLITGLADSANTTWGLQFFAPSSMDDGAEKSSTITITATLS